MMFNGIIKSLTGEKVRGGRWEFYYLSFLHYNCQLARQRETYYASVSRAIVWHAVLLFNHTIDMWPSHLNRIELEISNYNRDISIIQFEIASYL